MHVDARLPALQVLLAALVHRFRRYRRSRARVAGRGGPFDPGVLVVDRGRRLPAVVQRDQRYGTDSPQQALDVFVPDRGEECAAVPVVVWVHGGTFATGDKGNNVADKVELFNDAGWAFASVNYRLLDEARAVPEPYQPQDVAAAIAWLNTHADDVGLDPTRVALVGHSAGAYLTADVATDPAFDASLRGAVVLDTGRFAPPRVPASVLVVTARLSSSQARQRGVRGCHRRGRRRSHRRRRRALHTRAGERRGRPRRRHNRHATDHGVPTKRTVNAKQPAEFGGLFDLRRRVARRRGWAYAC